MGAKQVRIVDVGAQFNSDDVMQVTKQPPARLTVFDLSSVSRIDWMALAMLADCRARMRAKGGELALVGVNDLLGAALQRLGIRESVPVYDSIEAASLALQFGFAS